MSKRSGNFIPFKTMIDELGPDATRLVSLLTSLDQTKTINLQQLRSHSDENPVYYLHYAGVRISSIQKVAEQRGIARVPLEDADLTLLVRPTERNLIRGIEALPEVIEFAAERREPHHVMQWAREFAGTFHSYYKDARVLGEDNPPELTQARLWLLEGAEMALSTGFQAIGIHTPEQMYRRMEKTTTVDTSSSDFRL